MLLRCYYGNTFTSFMQIYTCKWTTIHLFMAFFWRFTTTNFFFYYTNNVTGVELQCFFENPLCFFRQISFFALQRFVFNLKFCIYFVFLKFFKSIIFI